MVESTMDPFLEVSPLEEFISLNSFYNNFLRQNTGGPWERYNATESRRLHLGFFAARSLEEVRSSRKGILLHDNYYRSDVGDDYDNLLNVLSQSGIISIEGVKVRVRQFEEDFFPGEFKKAAVGIRRTRDWLKSLKSEGEK